MRDVAILLILIALVRATFYRPWIGVLGLAVLAYMQPHAYAWGFARELPVFQLLFLAVAASAALRYRELHPPPLDWRLAAIGLLWLWFLVTTLNAQVSAAAWPRMLEITKVLAPLAFTMVLIDTRAKLYWLIATIATAIALVTVKGGYWAIMTGFSDRVYGPPESQYSDNNHFAVLVIMNIPLLLLWLREAQARWLRYVLAGAIVLSVAAAMSSWSRGALITLAVTALVLIWSARQRLIASGCLAVGLAVALAYLPADWFQRMETIVKFEGEGSAMDRLRIWRVGILYALENPVLGAGFDGWVYVTRLSGALDWHSAYVEMAAEHGLVGLALWAGILFGTMLELGRLAARGRRDPGLAWAVNHATMLRASLVAYATGSLFLGLSYWDIWFHLVVIAVLLRRLATGDARAAGAASRPAAMASHAPGAPVARP